MKPDDRPLRHAAAIHWVAPALIAGLAYADLAARSVLHGGASLDDLFRCVVIASLAIFYVAIHHRRTGEVPPLAAILIPAFAFHAIGVAGAPVLEDDAYRYIFDGWLTAERGTPYGIAPSTYFDKAEVPAAIEDILSGINNPDLPTIYGPTTQWVFRALYAISPGDIRAHQFSMAAMSFAIILLLARRVHPVPLVFLAWHPLMIKEFALTAHPDVLAVLLLVVAMLIPRRYAFAIGLSLGLAVGAKLFAALLVPAIARKRAFAWLGIAVALTVVQRTFRCVAF